MSKQAYYFSHDSNARNDEKILALRMKLGMEGYGIFWAILEKMRDNSDHMCVKDYNTIAFDLRVGAEKIKSTVEDFGLFQFTDDGKRFYSDSFNKRMDIKETVSQKRSEAAKKRWSKAPEKEEVNANAMQMHSKSNAIKGKESKGKEKKENKEDEEDVYINIDTLFERYIGNERLINAVIANGNFKSKDDVKAKLQKFNKHLDSLGQDNKTWKDYTSHFLNWSRKPKKSSSKSPTDVTL